MTISIDDIGDSLLLRRRPPCSRDASVDVRVSEPAFVARHDESRIASVVDRSDRDGKDEQSPSDELEAAEL